MGEVRQHPRSQPAGLAAPVHLTDQHDISTFDCGQPPLNDWLRGRAAKNEGRFSRTYVVCDGRRVAGYFCTAVGSIEHRDVPGRLRRNAPNPIPIGILARLAVDQAYQGRGLGPDLLADALRRIAAASEHVGMCAVLVHAKDEQARAFYMKQAEFIEYPAESRTLYLPIETILSAF